MRCDYGKNRNRNGLVSIGVCGHFANHYFGGRLVICPSPFVSNWASLEKTGQITSKRGLNSKFWEDSFADPNRMFVEFGLDSVLETVLTRRFQNCFAGIPENNVLWTSVYWIWSKANRYFRLFCLEQSLGSTILYRKDSAELPKRWSIFTTYY